MIVRLATKDDATAIADLVACGDREFSAAPQIFREGNLEEVMQYVANDSAVVAEDGGVVGMLCVTVTNGRGMIGDLIVKPSHRGAGVGRALVEYGHKKALADGGTTALAVIWHEKGLQPFYESVGYRQIGIVMEAAL